MMIKQYYSCRFGWSQCPVHIEASSHFPTQSTTKSWSSGIIHQWLSGNTLRCNISSPASGTRWHYNQPQSGSNYVTRQKLDYYQLSAVIFHSLSDLVLLLLNNCDQWNNLHVHSRNVEHFWRFSLLIKWQKWADRFPNSPYPSMCIILFQ